MKAIVRSFLFILCSAAVYTQDFSLVTPLEESLGETSGLLYLNEKIITHTDAGGVPELYEIHPTDGSVTRIVTVSNATNIDWEDLASDDQYIYIGDFGNVSGDRTDLRIYRVAISEYLQTSDNTIMADIIEFSYADQTDFTSNLFSTNYDAEALISFGDSLYIFTKNWMDQRTNIYAVSKLPGTYSAELIDNFDSRGLVTAATHNTISNNVVLTGYTFTTAFIIELRNFSNSLFSNGSINRYDLQTPSGYSMQLEAITFINENEYFITAETGMMNQNSGLYTLTDSVLELENYSKNKSVVYPNPAKDQIEIISGNFSSVEIFDIKGSLLKYSTEKKITITSLKEGVYFLKINYQKDSSFAFQKLVIRQF